MKSRALKTLKQPGRLGRSARSPIGTVVRVALSDDVLRMLSHEPGARRGVPDDVHQMRTSVRRLRSDLRFFGPMLCKAVSRPLRDELRWLAGVLGAVRDLDVLEHRLREEVVGLELVAPSDPVFEEIDRRRRQNQSQLVEVLDGDRYASLRTAIVAESRSPTLAEGADRPGGAPIVDRLARDWRRFLSDLKATPPEAPVETLHEFRKQAKRMRYAAESAEEWLAGKTGNVARRIARQAKEVQETLGLSQDAHVASAFLQDLLPTLPETEAAHQAALLLIDRQSLDAEEAIAHYRSVRDRILHD